MLYQGSEWVAEAVKEILLDWELRFVLVEGSELGVKLQLQLAGLRLKALR